MQSSSYENLIRKMRSLHPGDKVIYFTGFLDCERATNPTSAASVVAAIAYDLAMRGQILLTQERIGPPLSHGRVDWHGGSGPGFHYIATGAYPRREKINFYNRPVNFTTNG